MKKVLFSLFFICIFLVPALADYQVDSVAVSAEVSAKGRAQVTTTVQLTFDTATEQVTIPLANADVSRVSAGDYRFSVDETDDGTDVIVKNKDGFVGTQTFLITYTVSYADDGDDEADTFTLGLLSSRWARPIGSCSFQVIMPQAFEAEPQIVSGYYGILSAADAGLTVTDTSFSGSVTERMAYDSLSVVLTLPNQYFAVRSATIPVISITFLSVGMLAVLLLCILYWRLKLRSRRVSSSPRLLRPEGILPCQLPTVLDGSTCDVSAMILEWANLGYLSISYARSGTPVLTRLMVMGSERSKAEQRLFAQIFAQRSRTAITPGRFSRAAAQFRAASNRSLHRVIFDPKSGNPALVQIPCRLLLALGIGYMAYQLLPEGGGFVVLAVLIGLVGLFYSLQLHNALLRFAALRSTSPVLLLCLALMLSLLPISLMAGTFPEIAVGIAAILFSSIATAPGPRRSARGVDAMAQTKGCRTFYRQAAWKRLQVFQGKSARFFQTQLPNAVALGVEKQFARRFEDLSVPVPEWLTVPKKSPQTAKNLQQQLAPLLRQLREAFR